MNIAFYTPGWNRWKVSLLDAFCKKGHTGKWIENFDGLFVTNFDTAFSMWADEQLITLTNSNFKGEIFTYIRHYEIYNDYITRVNWKRVKAIFFCAKHIQDFSNAVFGKYIMGVPQYVVPNWLDVNEFTLRDESKNNFNIAMSCLINRKKNLPLALQIMLKLPDYYVLNIAGRVQDNSIMNYIFHFSKENGLSKRIIYHGDIPPEKMNDFYNQNAYILSTSITEGCPMNILEGMACGLTPVIHNWIGAEQFPGVFNSVKDAVNYILGGFVCPKDNRRYVIDYHNPALADKVVKIVEGLI